MSLPGTADQFIASLPARYAQAFTALETQQHARIASERGEKLAHAGQFASARHRGTALCIVASDRPGLLATISAALRLVEFSVIEAEIFTRRVSPSAREAVDLFWVVRRAPLQKHAILPADLLRLNQYLVRMLSESARVVPERSSAFIQNSPTSSTRVRFVDDAEGRFATLEIDTHDCSGLLLAVCQTLFAADVQIVGSHITTRDGHASGRFQVTELDERPIAAERRQELQMAVLTAVDELVRAAGMSAAG